MKFLNIKLIVLLLRFSTVYSRYDFSLFENFELTQKGFVEEQTLVKTLQNNRQYIHNKIKNLNISENKGFVDYIDNNLGWQKHSKNVANFLVLKSNHHVRNKYRFSLNLSYTRQYYLNNSQKYIYKYEYLQNRSEVEIMETALEGLIMLQETYHLDIKEYSKGHLFLNSDFEKPSRNIDSLNTKDLASMSNIAFRFYKWYDTGLQYLKQAIDLFYSIPKENQMHITSSVEKYLLTMKNYLSAYHNNVRNKANTIIGIDWKVFPYKVDSETFDDILDHTYELQVLDYTKAAIEVGRRQLIYLEGQFGETLFQNICNGNIKGSFNRHSLRVYNGKIISVYIQPPKCHLTHHFIPFLLMGPFLLEVKMRDPFRSVIHDFLSDKEMRWLIEYSKPLLSSERTLPVSTEALTASERRYLDPTLKGVSVAKAVTVWIRDIKYDEEERYKKVNSDPLIYEVKSLTDPYSFTLENKIMHDVSRRIELVTKLNVTTRHGSSLYQVTNYGLSGMVQPHMDPWGYEQGMTLVEDRKELTRSGDLIATFMGWLQDTQEGGGTAFTSQSFEGTIKPKKGAAAFWINLRSCHEKDVRSEHGGCPVLKGSKWILNKWISSWDQWKSLPCYLMPYQTIVPF